MISYYLDTCITCKFNAVYKHLVFCCGCIDIIDFLVLGVLNIEIEREGEREREREIHTVLFESIKYHSNLGGREEEGGEESDKRMIITKHSNFFCPFLYDYLTLTMEIDYYSSRME